MRRRDVELQLRGQRALVSETDFTEDLKKFDMPTLILHGDDDQIVPIGASAMLFTPAVKAVRQRQGVS